MNENSLPSTRKERGYTVLHITPALRCFHCPRLTNILILDPAFQQPEPLCPLHGYTSASDDETAQELQIRFESVRRYALWMFHDMGSIPVVSPVADLNTIAGYLPDEGASVDELAFFVTHEDERGRRQDAYVVWSTDDNQFYLYRDGALVESRESESVA